MASSFSSQTRRTFLKSSAALPLVFSTPRGMANETPPNIVVFIADDVDRHTWGFYGHPTIKTPHLDSLAQEGIRFTNAFVTASSCSPSRCSFFTGRYPHATGADELHMPLPAEQTIFTELLQQAGYYCANYRKFHIGNAKQSTLDHVDGSLENWPQFFDTRPGDKPFFLCVGFVDPHRPYQADTIPEPHDPDESIVPPYLADDPVVRKDIAQYYDEISRLDGVVGDVVARLKEDGLYENTLIVFWGDNGMPFPRAKTTLYDSGIATPMLAVWPGHVPPGSTEHGLASTVDLAPTFLEAAGIRVPDEMQGHSLLPRLKEPNSESRDSVFAERNWHDIDDHARAVRTQRFKYIRNTYPDEALNDAADVLRGPTAVRMRELRDAGLLSREQMLAYRKHRAHEELFDLVRDPYEFRNVANDPAYASVLKQMRSRLDQWKEETGDTQPDRRRMDSFDRNTGRRIAPPDWPGTAPFRDEVD